MGHSHLGSLGLLFPSSPPPPLPSSHPLPLFFFFFLLSAFSTSSWSSQASVSPLWAAFPLRFWPIFVERIEIKYSINGCEQMDRDQNHGLVFCFSSSCRVSLWHWNSHLIFNLSVLKSSGSFYQCIPEIWKKQLFIQLIFARCWLKFHFKWSKSKKNKNQKVENISLLQSNWSKNRLKQSFTNW